MPEQQNIEWKESWRDEYLKWICGFANAQGGKLYIGCDDGGKVVGVSDSKKLLEDIPNKIRDAMGIVVDVNRLTEGDREYIEIDVPPYPIGISCKGVYHYRSGSTKQVLTGPALEAFLMRKHGIIHLFLFSKLRKWMIRSLSILRSLRQLRAGSIRHF